MCKILIFGGTTEGRLLAEFCVNNKIRAYVSVATEVGEAVLEKSPYLNIISGRLKSEEMSDFILKKDVKTVIDATHPYAVEATRNIRKACEICKTEYIRIKRDKGILFENARYFDDICSVVKYLNQKSGIIMITTGSKDLDKYCSIENYAKRCVVRVLPNDNVLTQCRNLGFSRENTIAEKPPFSYENNFSQIKQYNINYLVTKDSGSVGGFEEKVTAAMDNGAEVLIIRRPEECGCTVEEAKKIIISKRKSAKKISVVGIGMDGSKTLTAEALDVVKRADILIGSQRTVKSFEMLNKPAFITYDTEKIKAFISECNYSNIAVLMSGDCGFYSGAKKLVPMISDYSVEVISGISSPTYFCAKIGVPWSDMNFVSLHGKNNNIVRSVSRCERTFFLLGGDISASDVCKRLCEYSLGNIKVYIGENLSLENEKIHIGRADEFTDLETERLCVMVAENPDFEKTLKICIPDDCFIRGNIPMTKAEVRSICVSKLNIGCGSVCWDIGSGTGSVSVEAAMQCYDGTVYAVDKSAEAARLTALNAHKFLCDNIIVSCAEAESVVDTLPKPDCVFIGGSGGSLKRIIDTALEKNRNANIVVTAVTLETLNKCLEIFGDYKGEPEIIQISVTRTIRVGEHTMLKAENPIFIISFCLKLKAQSD